MQLVVIVPKENLNFDYDHARKFRNIIGRFILQMSQPRSDTKELGIIDYGNGVNIR